MSIDDWASVLRVSHRLRNEAKAAIELNEKRLFRIRQFKRSTKVIVYPEYKNAFDYVHELYPDAGVKQATIYQTSKAVLYEVGYKGVGGFYDTRSRVVVISNWVAPAEDYEDPVKAEFTIDEVLCHELIHYAANFNRPTSLRTVEEEIAYGKSINYLRSNGRSDDFIIRKNMMPYLLTIVDKARIMHDVLYKAYATQLPDLAAISEEAKMMLVQQMSKRLEKAFMEEAYEIGKKMITLYGDKKDVVDNSDVTISGKNLILEDD